MIDYKKIEELRDSGDLDSVEYFALHYGDERFVAIRDLVASAEDCELLEEAPDEPYLLLVTHQSAYAGRGYAGLFYGYKPVVGEILRGPGAAAYGISGPSIGLFSDARKKIMEGGVV